MIRVALSARSAQEAIGGILSIVAVGFVTWMVFWMGRHARHLSGELHSRVDAAADAGGAGLVLVAMLAVGREGLETALFLWAATQAAAQGAGGSLGPVVGALLGLLTAVALGIAFYAGVLRINLAVFFRWTGAFLVLVAAGVLAYGVHDLQEAGLLPGPDSLAFDVSGAVPPTSLPGTLLKGVLNFTPATTWLQAVAWTAYVVPVMALFWTRTRPPRRTPAPPTVRTPQES